jgi:hypothetical protein
MKKKQRISFLDHRTFAMCYTIKKLLCAIQRSFVSGTRMLQYFFFLNGKRVSKDPDKLLVFHRRCILYNQAPKVNKITKKA